MHLDAAVVIDQTEFAEAIHKKADARSSGADHFCQGLLGNERNELFRFAGLAKFRHQQENPRQTFFAGVEELIDKIGLDPHAARQKELKKDIRKCRLIMHNTDHLISSDSECRTGTDGGCRGQTQPHYCRQRLFSHKFASRQKCNCGLFADTTVSLALPLCK